MSDPNNSSSAENPVGRFMVAVGAVVEHSATGKILIVQRADNLDWHPGAWEVVYGRIDQHEDPETGLHRELQEEIGLTDLVPHSILRVWHIYRGSVKAENDLVGITYHAQTQTPTITLSAEHQAWKWVTPAEALTFIEVEGIRQDIQAFQKMKSAAQAATL